MYPVNPVPTYSDRVVTYNLSFPNWNFTENLKGAIIKYYCQDTYTYTDKTLVKSFHCEQIGNKGIWIADQPGNWIGCLGNFDF